MPSIDTTQNTSTNEQTKPVDANKPTLFLFPDKDEKQRLSDYVYYEKLFQGNHYEAFNVRISSEDYNKNYSKLRFVMANFAGLISKIVADMLFSEPVTIKVEEGGDQDFVDELWEENNMDVQCYESALSNSYSGDAIFKLRVGKRHPNDEKPTVIIEDVTPRIYFPKLDPFNVKAEPLQQELAWVFMKNGNKFLRKEIQEPGKIFNQVFKMDGDAVKESVGLDILGIADLLPEEETLIDDSLIVHVPNWKVGNRHFGFSDYLDIDSLFFAIDNRLSKNDNILDKHSDPILMVPPGVLDENGNVRKKSLGVIEIGEGEAGKPEYVVWDASLENAFKEIEKLVEMIYMIGEVSPDVLGLGQGTSDSGRALKFKLMRTIAKVARKKMYYDRAIKRVMLIAQKLAKAHGIEINGTKLKGEPTEIDIDWADGLPIDDKEQLENETLALAAGITSKKAAAMRVYNVDEQKAEELIKETTDENALAMPTMGMGNTNPFQKGNQDQKATDNPKNTPPAKPPVSK